MAEDSTEKPGGGSAVKQEEPTYHRDRLIAEAPAFFGVSSPVVVAALSQGRAAHKVHFTRPEVEKAIKEILDHEVEIDHPHPEDEEE